MLVLNMYARSKTMIAIQTTINNIAYLTKHVLAS